MGALFLVPPAATVADVRAAMEALFGGGVLGQVASKPQPDTPEVVRRHLGALVGDSEVPEFGEPDIAARARTLHLRRQLHAALDHGTAVLAALGLPRLVGPDFAPIDREAAGDALDAAVAVLDALDGDPDLEDGGDAEPWLGWISLPHGGTDCGSVSDGEDDSEENEGTALETAGRGFVRAGEDDAEPGGDDEPSLGAPEMHFERMILLDGHWCPVEPDQRLWAAGGLDDRELGDDNGIGDEGGLVEVMDGCDA